MSATTTRTRRIRTDLLVLAGLVLGGATMVLPFLWMLSTSLKQSKYVYEIPPRWIPDPIDWANYAEIWNVVPLGQGLELLARSHPGIVVSIEWERPWHPDLPPAEVALPAGLAHLRRLIAGIDPTPQEAP